MTLATRRACLLYLGAAVGLSPAADEPRATPAPRAQTDPVPTAGDSADDPAVWVHPDNPAESLILGTDKKGGLLVFGMDGRTRQTVSPDSRPNNVDVIYGVRLGAKTVDLAVAGCRTKAGPGMKVWTIDPSAGKLAEAGGFPVFNGGEPYGSCAYTSPKDGRVYVFVNDHGGRFEQYRLDGRGGKIVAEKVRAFALGSQSEGCVADNERGDLYVGEEDVGIWKLGAEPDAGDTRTLVAKVGDHGLAADVEGLTIYHASGGRGYLIASSQGSNTYHVYDTAPPHAHLLTIDPKAGTGGISDVSETDGIDAVNVPTSPRFPRGLFVVQDGGATPQNFKLFAWEDIAGSTLVVDPTHPVRPKPKAMPVGR